jgi:hypothetical protein
MVLNRKRWPSHAASENDRPSVALEALRRLPLAERTFQLDGLSSRWHGRRDSRGRQAAREGDDRQDQEQRGSLHRTSMQRSDALITISVGCVGSNLLFFIGLD